MAMLYNDECLRVDDLHLYYFASLGSELEVFLVDFLLVSDTFLLAELCCGFFLGRLGIGFDSSCIVGFCITRNTPALSLFLSS